jgi:methyltransferase (TIGR00027 family)
VALRILGKPLEDGTTMSDEATRSRMLASTAHWMAAVRAKESERENRLFDDPWAAALAGSEGLAWIEQRSADSVIPIVLRTRFFDDFLQRIVHEHAIRQLVLVGAGLDTRAYRLCWPPQMRLFELDQAPVLQHKERVLRSTAAEPTCQRHAIPVDLTAPWETTLAEAGFDPGQPSGWLLEGFLFYLSTENLTRVLERAMSLAAPGSYVGFDIVNSLTLTSPLTQGWVQMQADSGAPWIGTMEDPEAFLMSHGWQTTLTAPGAADANYGRWPYPVIPVTMPGMPHLWFVRGERPARGSLA